VVVLSLIQAGSKQRLLSKGAIGLFALIFVERSLCAKGGSSQFRSGTAPETTLSVAATFRDDA
jgi:hypothetical protein